jgi:hypothetical protein
LSGYSLLVLIEAEQIDEEIAAAMRNWVHNRGILVAEQTDETAFYSAGGSGQVIRVAPEEEACATAVFDLLEEMPPGRCDAARTAAQWMKRSGSVFATVFEAGTLLANLSREEVRAENGSRQVCLPGLSIEFIDR